MEENRNRDIKHVYVRERQTDDVFRFWKAATVDEIQPERLERERVRSPYTGHRERKFFKSSATFALLLVSTIFAAGIATTHQTLSYFNDIDSSNANSLNAGILDLKINGVDFSGAVTEGETGVVVDPLLSGAAGSFNIEYKVRAEKISGDEPFCNLIAAHIEGDLAYTGPLLLFTGGPSLSVGINTFNLSLPDATGVANGDECAIDLVYTAWAKDAIDEQGYIDEERVHITLTATGLPEQAPALFNAFNLFSSDNASLNETDEESDATSSNEESDADGSEKEEKEKDKDSTRKRETREEREERKTSEEETSSDESVDNDAPIDTPAEQEPKDPTANQESPVEDLALPVVTETPTEPLLPTEPTQPELPSTPVSETPPAE